MINILKEVARGKRGARDLSYDEAYYAAESILGQTASPVQIGAFLIAERIKLESIEELEAFVTVCRKVAHREPVQQGLDCAGPYDGRTNSFVATFPTAFLLSAAGVPVTLHGSRSLPPKWGVRCRTLFKPPVLRLPGCPGQTRSKLQKKAASSSPRLSSGVLRLGPSAASGKT